MFFRPKKMAAILLTLSLLPLPLAGNAEQAPSPDGGAAVTRWTRNQFSEPVTVTGTVILEQEAVLSDSAELLLEGGRLVVTKEAAFHGDIVLAGDGAAVEIEGTVHGNIRVTAASARVYVAGSVHGTVTLDGLAHLRKEHADVSVEITENGYVKILVLAGVGFAEIRGVVDLIDTDPSNAAQMDVRGGTVGTLYARSDAQYNFSERTRVGTIYMDCLQRSMKDGGGLHNVAVWKGSHVNVIVIDGGHAHVGDGSGIDTLFLYGKGSAHLDQGYLHDGEAWPTGYALQKASAGKVIQIGRLTACSNGGYIGFHYVEDGYAGNSGCTETLVASRAYVDSKAGASIEPPGKTINLFSTFFDKHYGTLLSLGSSLNMNKETVIGELLVDGGDINNFHATVETLVLDAGERNLYGSVSSDARIGTLVSTGKGNPSIRTENIGRGVLPNGEAIGELEPGAAFEKPKAKATGGKSAAKAAPLADGAYYVPAVSGSQWFAVACDPYTALELTVDAEGGYGFALVKSPDGDWRFLDLTGGPQALSLLNQTAGAYEIRLIGAPGTMGFALGLKTEAPLRIDYTLTERASVAQGEAPAHAQGDIREYSVSVYNETAGQPVEEVTLGEAVIYAMPEAVSPGDTLTLSLCKKDGTIQPYAVTVTLDGRRHAAAALEGAGRGHFEAKLSDAFRAHVYLYGGDGAFLREIFQKDGAYTTGPLEAGEYHIAMIRAGAGGWKMLHVSGFEANGLLPGEHYLLDSFTIADGVAVRRENVAVPEEPPLQSQWLNGAGTGYQARVSSVVKGGLALMALEWSLAREQMTDVNAEIAFLSGAAYVKGSAAIEGQAVEASWKDGVLRVPLEKPEGKLLFYMEGDGTSEALVSNASIAFFAGGRAHTQYIGSAQTRIVPLSIHGPTLVSEPSVTLYGYTSPYSVAYLYDNDAQAGSVLSDGNGLWSAHIPLSKDRLHLLAVGTGEEGVLSEPIEMYRASGAPTLEHFAFHYVEHGLSKKIAMEGELFGRWPVKFAYEPGTDLTFVLRIGNDAYVDTVTVVAEMNGQREEMPAQRQKQSGDWVAVGQFTKDQMFAPDAFAIEYTFREDALELAFQEPFIAVPLMNTLLSASDLEGKPPLTRHYMASPTLQAVDVGFGPGWFTDYSVFAEVHEEDGAQRLTLWSPTGTRTFTGTKGRYAEDAGYATAKAGAKGALTVTEATGAAMTFDADGRLATLSDPYKRKTTLSYDGQGRLSAVAYGGQSLELAYGADGLVESAAVGDRVVTYRYTNGHLTGVDGPNGHISYTYDGLLTGQGAHPLTCSNGASGVFRFRYDEEGMPVLLDEDGVTTEIAYTPETVTMRRDGGVTVYRLDEGGRCVRVEYPDGSHTESAVSQEGVLTRSVWADGRATEALYNPLMELLWHRDENGNTLRFAYDSAGNLTGVTDANGNETQYAYDKAGNLTRIIHADGTAERYAYSGKDGSLTGYTDRAGKKTAYSYDRQGNPVRDVYPDRASAQYSCDEAGNVTWIQEGNRQVWISYDDDGGRNYGFDDGRNIYLYRNDSSAGVHAGPDQHVTNSQYEGSRLARVYGPWEEAPLVELEYDGQGQLVREARANGTYTTYAYADGRLARMENHGGDGGLHSFYAYAYDGAGNILRQETREGVWQYAYDAAGQLTRVTDPGGGVTQYAYDAAGNRLSQTVEGMATGYEANALNQYTRVGDTAYTYDKNGRLTRKEGPEGATEYGWDARGRLVFVDDGQTRTQYEYDLFGNRSAVTVNEVTTRYTVAPAELPFVVFSDAGDGETYYHYGDNGLVASQKNGERVYYSFTPLGSVSEITDAQGHVLRQYAYDAMGRVVSEWAYTPEELPEGTPREEMDAAEKRAALAQATASNPFTYVGRYGIMDDGNGLWYMRARYTAQDVSRFISPDPAGQMYDVNVYRYAGNDPVTYVDVTGQGAVNALGKALMNLGQNAGKQGGKQAASQGGKQAAKQGAKAEGSIFGENALKGKTAGADTANFNRLAGMAGAAVFSVLFPEISMAGDLLHSPTGDGTMFRPDGKVTEPENYNPDGSPKRRLGKSPGYPMGRSPVKSAVDPSGYVYEAVPSNRVEGVTATVYYRDDEGRAVEWNAEEYSQQNPQITDFLGQYAWYVPTGSWRVVYEKEGFEPLQTAWLPVPPPQTEVNMGLTSYGAPRVAHAALYGDGAEITFSKYMDIGSVAQSVSLAGPEGAEIPVAVSALNPEPMAGDGQRLLASRFRLAFQGDTPEEAVLTVTPGAVSYAGIAAEAYHGELTRAWHLESLGQQAEYLMTPYSVRQIELQASGEGHYRQLSLTVALNAGADVTVDSVTPFDEDGRAFLTVTAGDVGKATLSITEKTTGFTAAVLLTVQPQDAD